MLKRIFLSIALSNTWAGRPLHGPACPTSSFSLRSKVRRGRDRHRVFLKLEGLLVAQIVLSAGPFRYGAAGLLQVDHACPGCLERTRIIHSESGFEPVSAIRDLPSFHNVQVLGVRRVIVYEAQGMFDEPDSVDDELAVLVMADGFAKPSRLRVGVVFAVEIDAAHLMVALPDHPDLIRCLDEIDGLKEQQLARRPARPAPGLGA